MPNKSHDRLLLNENNNTVDYCDTDISANLDTENTYLNHYMSLIKQQNQLAQSSVSSIEDFNLVTNKEVQRFEKIPLARKSSFIVENPSPLLAKNQLVFNFNNVVNGN